MQIGIDKPNPFIHLQTFFGYFWTQSVLCLVLEAIGCDQFGFRTRFRILATNAIITDGRDVGRAGGTLALAQGNLEIEGIELITNNYILKTLVSLCSVNNLFWE